MCLFLGIDGLAALATNFAPEKCAITFSVLCKKIVEAAMRETLDLEAGNFRKIQPIPRKVGDQCVEVQKHSSTDAHHGEEPQSDYAVLIATDRGTTDVQSPSKLFALLLDPRESPDTIEKPLKDTKKSLWHIAHLNGLRAFAFIGVALFHFKHETSGGFLGADIFS